MTHSLLAMLRVLGLAIVALPLASPSPAQAQWQPCANQDEVCRFKGEALVRYGADGRYAFQVARNRINCESAISVAIQPRAFASGVTTTTT